MNYEPTVFIVDDDGVVRDSLRILLNSIQIKCETFSSPREYLDSYDPERAGCLILDIRMPGISGLELQRILLRNEYVVPIIIISGYADVPMAVKAMEANAFTFLEKPVNEEVLLEYIHEAMEKDRIGRSKWLRRKACAAKFHTLTTREKEIVRLVEIGDPNKVIARKLDISIKTVDFHRHNIKCKLDVESLAELIHMAIDTGNTSEHKVH